MSVVLNSYLHITEAFLTCHELFQLQFCGKKPNNCANKKKRQKHLSFLINCKETMEENTTWPQFQVDFITTVDTYVTILQTITYIIVVTIGIPLVLGIISYERIGVDAKKRSIFNQLISAFFRNVSVNIVFIGFFVTIRCWIGPLDSMLSTFLTIARRLGITSLVFIILEGCLYKIICLVNPTFILSLDDDYWTTYIIVWNIILSFLLTTAYWISVKQYPPIYLFLSGEEESEMNMYR